MKGMSPEQYFKFHEDLCNEARALSQRKNNDYASPDSNRDDPMRVFRNFMQCEHMGICSVEQGFLVRLSDKFSRLGNLTREGHKRAVNDESVRDTMLDIINYICLWGGYREAREDG